MKNLNGQSDGNANPYQSPPAAKHVHLASQASNKRSRRLWLAITVIGVLLAIEVTAIVMIRNPHDITTAYLRLKMFVVSYAILQAIAWAILKYTRVLGPVGLATVAAACVSISLANFWLLWLLGGPLV